MSSSTALCTRRTASSSNRAFVLATDITTNNAHTVSYALDPLLYLWYIYACHGVRDILAQKKKTHAIVDLPTMVSQHLMSTRLVSPQLACPSARPYAQYTEGNRRLWHSKNRSHSGILGSRTRSKTLHQYGYFLGGPSTDTRGYLPQYTTFESLDGLVSRSNEPGS